MRIPKFNPPMKFVIERNGEPLNLFDDIPLPFAHNEFNFQLTYEKRLTSEEINSGYLVYDVCNICITSTNLIR